MKLIKVIIFILLSPFLLLEAIIGFIHIVLKHLNIFVLDNSKRWLIKMSVSKKIKLMNMEIPSITRILYPEPHEFSVKYKSYNLDGKFLGYAETDAHFKIRLREIHCNAKEN